MAGQLNQSCYTITISDAQRKMLIFALGHLFPAIKTETTVLLTPAEFLTLGDLLISAQPARPAIEGTMNGDQAARAMLSPPAPASQSPTIELRDRWARNRKGQEEPNPKGCESRTVYIEKIEHMPNASNGAKRIKVTFSYPEARGMGTASCFDENLFGFLANRMKQSTVLHINTSGKYLNIVGVRA